MKLSRLLSIALLMILAGSAIGARQKLVSEAEDVMRPQIAAQCFNCGPEIVFVDLNSTVAHCRICGKALRAAGEKPDYKLKSKPRIID